jgi:vacuolar protein sorting-associated protein 16
MNPTADWEKVGDRYYRKIQLYTAVFDQDLELENHILTGAPYGGAIGTFFVLFYNVYSQSLLSNC